MRNVLVAGIAVLALALAGCSNPFGIGPASDSTSADGTGSSGGSDGATSVETSFDTASPDDLEGFTFSGPTDGTPFVIDNGVLTLDPSLDGVGGWYTIGGPALALDSGEGSVVASFDFRYPDAFPYGTQDEERAKFYFAFTSGGSMVYELLFKPKMSGNAVRHLWTGDADHSGYNNGDADGSTYLSRAYLDANVDSGASAGWYTAELVLAPDGTVTFSVYDENDDLVKSTASSGNVTTAIDGFSFSYRTTDNDGFYNIEVDNLSIGYGN
jgi:hypothetical protein